MAFLDDIKKSATDVANKAVKKTEEIAGVAKLQMNIKMKEAKLSSVYEEIGRLFYNAERNGVDFTSEIAGSILKADTLKVEIACAQAEIAKLRNLVICESCGNEIADDAAFCSYCGMKQVKPSPTCCEVEEYSACCEEETPDSADEE